MLSLLAAVEFFSGLMMATPSMHTENSITTMKVLGSLTMLWTFNITLQWIMLKLSWRGKWVGRLNSSCLLLWATGGYISCMINGFAKWFHSTKFHVAIWNLGSYWFKQLGHLHPLHFASPPCLLWYILLISFLSWPFSQGSSCTVLSVSCSTRFGHFQTCSMVSIIIFLSCH